MITIITCSIDPSRANRLCENIKETIGLPFEFIAFDNRKKGYGICKVYNICAEKAKYENLCFVHEDVEFKTPDWGKLIMEQLRKPNCGAIGFAGSNKIFNKLTTWSFDKDSSRINLIQGVCDKVRKPFYNNPNNEIFSEVITLDGLCIFVPLKVWKEVRFDDTTFKNFHAYDLDFAMSVVERKYKNFVCFNIDVIHFSSGNYSQKWLNEMIIFNEKWNNKIPCIIPNNSDELEYYNFRSEYVFYRDLMRYRLEDKRLLYNILDVVKEYPKSRKAWTLIWKYMVYRTRRIAS